MSHGFHVAGVPLRTIPKYRSPNSTLPTVRPLSLAPIELIVVPTTPTSSSTIHPPIHTVQEALLLSLSSPPSLPNILPISALARSQQGKLLVSVKLRPTPHPVSLAIRKDYQKESLLEMPTGKSRLKLSIPKFMMRNLSIYLLDSIPEMDANRLQLDLERLLAEPAQHDVW